MNVVWDEVNIFACKETSNFAHVANEISNFLETSNFAHIANEISNFLEEQ